MHVYINLTVSLTGLGLSCICGQMSGCWLLWEDQAGSMWLCSALYGLLWASQVALVVKNPPVNASRGRIPGLGRSPAGGHGNPLQYSCLENPMDWEAWRATVCGVAKSQMGQSDSAHIPCIAQGTIFNILWCTVMGKKYEKEYMHICITESPCCAVEINTTL